MIEPGPARRWAISATGPKYRVMFSACAGWARLHAPLASLLHITFRLTGVSSVLPMNTPRFVEFLEQAFLPLSLPCLHFWVPLLCLYTSTRALTWARAPLRLYERPRILSCFGLLNLFAVAHTGRSDYKPTFTHHTGRNSLNPPARAGACIVPSLVEPAAFEPLRFIR